MEGVAGRERLEKELDASRKKTRERESWGGWIFLQKLERRGQGIKKTSAGAPRVDVVKKITGETNLEKGWDRRPSQRQEMRMRK